MNPPQAEFLELYKAGLKSAVDLMKASLENAERLQQQQLSAIRAALEAHAKSMEALENAKTAEDLMALQRTMAGAQIERVTGYWSSLFEQQMAQARTWFAESYSLTTRATEEAARLAAAQASAAVREKPEKQRESAPPLPPRRGSPGAAMHR
jgi:hypothetical protein